MPGLEYPDLVSAYADAATGDPHAIDRWLRLNQSPQGRRLARIAPHVAQVYKAAAPGPAPLDTAQGAAQAERIAYRAARQLAAQRKTAKKARKKAARKLAATRARYSRAARESAQAAYEAGLATGAVSAPPLSKSALKPGADAQAPVSPAPAPDFSVYKSQRARISYKPSIYDGDPRARERAWEMKAREDAL
jgi:hypothetical protein